VGAKARGGPPPVVAPVVVKRNRKRPPPGSTPPAGRAPTAFAWGAAPSYHFGAHTRASHVPRTGVVNCTSPRPVRRAPGRHGLLWSLAALLVMAPLPACSGDLHDRLVGRWQLVEQDYELVIELRADGTYLAYTGTGPSAGRWELVDSSHIATWSAPDKPKRVSRFRLEDEALIVIDADGAALRHRRLPAEGQS